MGIWDTNFYSYPSCNPYDTMGLLQKEAMLGYNSRYNANVPSFANNWMAGSAYSMPYFNPTFGAGFNGNIFAPPTFTPSAPTNPANQPPITPTDATSVNQPLLNPDIASAEPLAEPLDLSSPSFKSLLNDCAEAYSKTNCIEDEGFKGAAIGAGSMYALENMQTLVHPKNTITAYKKINEIGVFAKVAEGNTNAARLWKEHSQVMQEAYRTTKKLLRDAQPKYRWSGLFKKASTEDLKYAEKLAKRLQTAINEGRIDGVKKLTAEMKCAFGGSGKIPSAWKRMRGENVIKKAQGRIDKARNAGEVAKHIEELGHMGESFGKLALNTAKKDAKIFLILDTIMGAGKVITCAKEDKKNREAGLQSQHLALKQAGQVALKAGINLAGWSLGRAAGIKLGATIGSFFCPGIGTAIGGAIGFLAATAGQWLVNKGMKAVTEKTNIKIFEDMSDRIGAKELAQTPEGAMQIAENLKEKIDKGIITDNDTISKWRTLNKYMQAYAQQKAAAEEAASQQQYTPQYA